MSARVHEDTRCDECGATHLIPTAPMLDGTPVRICVNCGTLRPADAAGGDTRPEPPLFEQQRQGHFTGGFGDSPRLRFVEDPPADAAGEDGDIPHFPRSTLADYAEHYRSEASRLRQQRDDARARLAAVRVLCEEYPSVRDGVTLRDAIRAALTGPPPPDAPHGEEADA